MKYISYLTLAATVLIATSCNSFKKEKEGISYKIISDGKGKKLEPGKFFQVQYDQTYKDSKIDTVLASSENFGDQFAQLDSTSIPPVYFRIFCNARKGDSLVIKQSTDSIIKAANGQIPPFIKKGQFIVAHWKIVDVFDTREQADKAFAASREKMSQKQAQKDAAQLKIDDKIITDYLAKNNITATKAPAGTYVQIVTEGTGNVLDTSVVAKVFYTGRSFSNNQVFDSNTDTKFGPAEPLFVYMNAQPGSPRAVIKGWTDGLSVLKKGSKAKFYIPSALGYGSRGAGEAIKPNEVLVFDIDVVDVVSQAQAKAEEEVAYKKAAEMQKRMSDSLQKVQQQAPEQKK